MLSDRSRGQACCLTMAALLVLGLAAGPACCETSMHFGIDIASPPGEPVKASDTGTVVSVKPYKRGENQITLAHMDGSESMYVYVRPCVEVGRMVYAGEVIGYSEPGPRGVSGIVHYAYRPVAGGGFADPETHLPQREGQ